MSLLKMKIRGVPCTQRRAFTLIEILVVVAIIALLISILLPSLRNAREQARTLACAANMRLCSQAIILYAQSSKDFFPYDQSQVGFYPASKNSYGLSNYGLNCWEFLHKYVQRSNPSSFTNWSKAPYIPAYESIKASTYYAYLDWYTCPSDQFYHNSPVRRSGLPGGKTDIEYLLSYSINISIPWDMQLGQVASVRKTGAIKRASDKMLITELGDDSKSMERMPWEMRDRNDVNNQIGFQIQHKGGQGGSNIVFVDGHIKLYKAMLGSAPWYGLPPANAASFEDVAVYDRTKPPTAPGNQIIDRAAPVLPNSP